MVHIPFKGGAPAFTDLIAGHVQFMAESAPQAAVYAKQGKVKDLAVTSAKRNPAFPNTPTVLEIGVGAHRLSSRLPPVDSPKHRKCH